MTVSAHRSRRTITATIAGHVSAERRAQFLAVVLVVTDHLEGEFVVADADAVTIVQPGSRDDSAMNRLGLAGMSAPSSPRRAAHRGTGWSEMRLCPA